MARMRAMATNSNGRPRWAPVAVCSAGSFEALANQKVEQQNHIETEHTAIFI
jgi:hypothetical protein